MRGGIMMGEDFTFTFTGKKAQEIAESFAAYFWDGGLDQTIEQEFLKEHNLDLDDVKQGENQNQCIINTDGH